MLTEERGCRPGLSLTWVFLILCFVAAMIFAIWVDITMIRIATTFFYYLIVGPLAMAVAALIMKVLASALFGWNIRYSWLLVITGFAFLAMQVLGQTNYLVYAFVWRFSRLVNLVALVANVLVFSAVVATTLKIASGRSWREAFLVTFVGAFGLSFLVFAIIRTVGLRTLGFWPIVGI